MRQTFFSLAQSPRPSVPYYWRGLLIGGRCRYLHRRTVRFLLTIFFNIQILYKGSMFQVLNRTTPTLLIPIWPVSNTAWRYRFRHPALFTYHKFKNVSVR